MLKRALWRLWMVARMTRQLFPSSHYALLSILFVVGLELIFALQQWVILVAVTVVLVVIIGVVLVRAEERDTFHPTYVILPVLATTGLSGFAFLLPTTWILHLYIAAAGLILYLLLKHGARQAYPIWNRMLALLIYFVNMGFILGLRFHLYVPVLFVLVMSLIISGLIGLQSLRRIAPATSPVALPVMALALVSTEMVWILLFLPSHFLVAASIMTILYYVTVNLLSIGYTRTLQRRDLAEYVGIGLAASLVILFSAKWT